MFPCTKCGCCCRRVNSFTWAVNNLDPDDPFYFPYKGDETGRCENLTDEDTCAVYENRPLVCNIEKFIEYFGLNKAEFYKENAAGCNKMMDQENLPQELRVVL